jgi:membrane fusion protein, multidrug efflux system
VVVEAESRAVLAAELEGVLTYLEVDVGDPVKNGAVLAEVYHQDRLLHRERLGATRTYLEILVENLTRLNEKGLATDEELAKAEMDLKVNAKEIEIVESQINRAQVRAPFSGTVVTRHIQPHEWVQPGQPVVEIYDPRKLRVVADISADVAVSMKAGDKQSLRFPDLGESVTAKVTVFSPQVDVRSNTIKVFWSVGARDARRVGLLPGMKGVLEYGAE